MLVHIFREFFLLGCLSFGGPVAHLAYFKRHFVDHLHWLSNTRYAQLISLSQVLPGPGSSQVGFAIGVERAGLLGGITAFIAFTLPSFAIMLLLAISSEQFDTLYYAVIASLKLFAVVVVADATFTMAKTFCKNKKLTSLALVSTLTLILFPTLSSQILVLVFAAATGLLLPMHPTVATAKNHSPAAGHINWFALSLFCLLLLLSFTTLSPDITLFAPFYQVGAMVFGGGHVVLPMLQTALPSLSDEQVLSAYASAQAIPGPMFTIATYLGAQLTTQPLVGACFATLLIFLPGLLLVFALQKSWFNLVNLPRFASSLAALNAAVVGFLAAALYAPIWPSAVHSPWQIVLIVVAFLWLRIKKPPIWWLLILFIGLSLIQQFFPL